MSKRLVLLMAVMLAFLIAATPALAAGPGNHNQQQSQNRQQSQEQSQGQTQSQEQNREQNRSGGQPDELPGRQYFTLTGTITALSGNSITVLVHNGNRFAKPYAGQELVVQVTPDTTYRRWTPGGCIPISFGDVEVGDSTSIVGTVSEGAFTALRVTVDVPCCTP